MVFKCVDFFVFSVWYMYLDRYTFAIIIIMISLNIIWELEWTLDNATFFWITLQENAS